jgi:hypothetical protein
LQVLLALLFAVQGLVKVMGSANWISRFSISPEKRLAGSTQPRMVKIFKCAERSRSSMMDVEDKHNHMRAAFGLRDRFGKPGTPARE